MENREFIWPVLEMYPGFPSPCVTHTRTTFVSSTKRPVFAGSDSTLVIAVVTGSPRKRDRQWLTEAQRSGNLRPASRHARCDCDCAVGLAGRIGLRRLVWAAAGSADGSLRVFRPRASHRRQLAADGTMVEAATSMVLSLAGRLSDEAVEVRSALAGSAGCGWVESHRVDYRHGPSASAYTWGRNSERRAEPGQPHGFPVLG